MDPTTSIIKTDWASKAFSPTAMDLQLRFVTAYAAMGSEWMRFLTHRFDQDVDWLRRCGSAKSPQEVFAITTQFVTETVREYGNEVVRLTEAGEEVLNGGRMDALGRGRH